MASTSDFHHNILLSGTEYRCLDMRLMQSGHNKQGFRCARGVESEVSDAFKQSFSIGFFEEVDNEIADRNRGSNIAFSQLKHMVERKQPRARNQAINVRSFFFTHFPPDWSFLSIWKKLSVKIANSRDASSYPTCDRQQAHFKRNMLVARRQMGLSFAEVVRGVKTLQPYKVKPSLFIPKSMGTKEQAYHSVVPSSSRGEFPSNKGVIYEDDIESHRGRVKQGNKAPSSKEHSQVEVRVSGISIGDSNVQNMNNLFLKKYHAEAVNLWNLGKHLGASFDGDKEIVRDHICKLEAQDQLQRAKMRK
ncbi:hypothetical protein Ancab_021662 [Ancistrocladus abbreviatus]